MKLDEQQALKRAAAYCSKAERCQSDIRRKLAAWELNEAQMGRIIERLGKERFFDEERFCRSFVNDKVRFNKWGRNKIVFELRKKQIPESVYQPIINELTNENFEEKLLPLLIAKNKSIKARDAYERRNKLIRFALGRGFDMQLVVKCVNRIIEYNGDDSDYME